MGTSSQFLAFFKMAPTLTSRYYAPINVKSQDWGGGGGVGQGVRILTFSEKMRQIPLPRDSIIGQKYQKGRVKVAKIISFRLCCTQ